MKNKIQMPDDQWFILKGESRFGPFSFEEVVRMLQGRSVFEFDFAWCAKMETWRRIAEIGDFSPENVRHFPQLFAKRAHKRKKFEGTVLVHDNEHLWTGKGVEISDGGVGVVMNNSMILPGQVLYLHFKAVDNMPSFNAVCEVVSKKFVGGIRSSDAPVQYGLKFKGLSAQAQKAVSGIKDR